MTPQIATRNGKVPTECVTWRWKGNLGDDIRKELGNAGDEVRDRADDADDPERRY